jgi:hypothetical protein
MVDGISADWKAAKRPSFSPGGDRYVGQTLGPDSGDVMP